nr:hypothetical protein [Tanacetum cinerariifolium]
GHRVLVGDGKLRIGLNGVGYHFSRVLAPQRVTFLGVVAHAEHGFAALRDFHGVPNELARRAPGKVTHVLGGVGPGFSAGGAAAFVFGGLVLAYDEHWLLGTFGLRQAAHLSSRQHLRSILQGAGGAHHVVGGRGDAHAVVAEGQRKLTVDAHHGVVDGVFQRLAAGIGYGRDFVAAVKLSRGQLVVNILKTQPAARNLPHLRGV